jgi:hypothetical protein
VKCANCGTELPPDEPGAERRPCPNCGSTARTHEVSGTLMAHATLSAEGRVERGVNETRMAAFSVIFTTVVGVGVSVGFASGPLLGLAAAALTVVVTALPLAAVYRVPSVRHVVMEGLHRITGQ